MAEYDRMIAAWLASGRTLPTPSPVAVAPPAGITVVELVDRYRESQRLT